MNFDMVFDIQHAYRQVVHAFAYPGEIVSLKQEADRLEAGPVSYTHLAPSKGQRLSAQGRAAATGGK